MPVPSTFSRRLVGGFVSVSLLLAGAGCANKTQTGAVVGAAGGAVVGGIIGKYNGSTAKGAIIGAAVGGAAGALIGSQMDKQAAELVDDIPGARIERVGEGIQVTFDSGILFDFDAERIKPEAGRNLDALARSLRKYGGSNLLIVGHTDNVGPAPYNQQLSERRAAAAANYLTAQGVARSRIAMRGLGETEPVASNNTAEGRSRNRRVEVAIFASQAMRDAARRQAGS